MTHYLAQPPKARSTKPITTAEPYESIMDICIANLHSGQICMYMYVHGMRTRAISASIDIRYYHMYMYMCMACVCMLSQLALA